MFSSRAAQQQIFEASNENIPNPERGFYAQDNISKSLLSKYRDSLSITIIRTYFRLDAYRDSDIPLTFLNKITNDFNIVREAGAKVIPRFAYNFGIGESDASLTRIQSHLKQLAPILRKNADVIAFMEAGFMGAWGEWHHSTHGLDSINNKRKILFSLLESLPKERHVALRYNFHKRDIFDNHTPLTKGDAYNGSDRSRTGAHNDCLGASIEDWGTYSYSSNTAKQIELIEKEKTFLNLDNRYVPQGGETCNPSSYSHCDTILKNLKRMRWDALNIDYEQNVLDTLKLEGCFDTIQKNLGYRIQLINASADETARVGGTFNFTVTLINVGWGKIYNPREVEIVLRNLSTKNQFYLTLKNDPRFWESGDTITISVAAGIPKELIAGSYALLLNLPDTVSILHDNPAYSIQLANRNTWESATGFNSLKMQVKVTSTEPGADYTGEQYFIPWGAKPLGILNRNHETQGDLKSIFKRQSLGSKVFIHQGVKTDAVGKQYLPIPLPHKQIGN